MLFLWASSLGEGNYNEVWLICGRVFDFEYEALGVLARFGSRFCEGGGFTFLYHPRVWTADRRGMNDICIVLHCGNGDEVGHDASEVRLGDEVGMVFFRR